MTASRIARTAFVTAATGAVLLSSLAVAGAASAAASSDSPGAFTTPPASSVAVLSVPTFTDPHGRKIG